MNAWIYWIWNRWMIMHSCQHRSTQSSMAILKRPQCWAKRPYSDDAWAWPMATRIVETNVSTNRAHRTCWKRSPNRMYRFMAWPRHSNGQSRQASMVVRFSANAINFRSKTRKTYMKCPFWVHDRCYGNRCPWTIALWMHCHAVSICHPFRMSPCNWLCSHRPAWIAGNLSESFFPYLITFISVLRTAFDWRF